MLRYSGLLAVVWALAQAVQAPVIAVSARSVQPGEVVVLDVATPAPADDVRARAFGAVFGAYRLDHRAWRVIVGIDLDVKPGPHDVALEIRRGETVTRATHVLQVAAKAFRTRTLTVDNAFVNPPASAEARIRDEGAELARLWRTSVPERLWEGAFERPVPHAANSAFGSRSVFNGQARSPHGGADFASPAGTPVRAPNAGRVVLARDLYYTGGTVVIDHGLGVVSLFAHLSSIDAQAGELVTPGQVVGKVGATGRVTGAHLHWTLRVSGARVDPLSLLTTLGAAASGTTSVIK